MKYLKYLNEYNRKSLKEIVHTCVQLHKIMQIAFLEAHPHIRESLCYLSTFCFNEANHGFPKNPEHFQQEAF
jgi:hypothetical protein